MGKGTDYERKLVRRADAVGFHPQRGAASGSSPYDLPDVILGKDGTTIALECKYNNSKPAYFRPEEVDALERYGEAHGAIILGACRWAQDTTWYFVAFDRLPLTDSGNYSASRITAQEEGWADGPDILQAINTEKAWEAV